MTIVTFVRAHMSSMMVSTAVFLHSLVTRFSLSISICVSGVVNVGYIDNTQSVNCDFGGESQTMVHLLWCRLLYEHSSSEDLITVTERAKACVRKWQHIVWRTREKNWVLSRSCPMFNLFLFVFETYIRFRNDRDKFEKLPSRWI